MIREKKKTISLEAWALANGYEWSQKGLSGNWGICKYNFLEAQRIAKYAKSQGVNCHAYKLLQYGLYWIIEKEPKPNAKN